MQILLRGKEVLRRPPSNCLKEDLKYFQTTYYSPDVSLETDHNVRVDGDGLIRKHFQTDKRSYAKEDIFNEMSTVQKMEEIVKPLYFLLKQKEYLENGIYITHSWTRCYFHWFCDALPRLLLVRDLAKDIPILLPERYKKLKCILPSLEPFNVKVKYLEGNKRTIVNNLYYVSQVTHTGNHIPEVSKELRNMYRQYCGTNEQVPTKVYISRSRVGCRRVVNEDDLVPILMKHGFSVLYMEDLEWKEQVRLMHNCEVLISPHGAGLTNMLFMNPNGRVLEIFQKPVVNGKVAFTSYHSLANALGLQYHYLFVDGVGGGNVRRNDDLFVDTTKFEKAIEEVEQCI